MNGPPFQSRTHARWGICALLFFGVTVNYLDRQVMGFLKPTLAPLFGWSEIDYAHIVMAFTAAYMIGSFFGGPIMDWLGVKRGLPGAVFGWSLSEMGIGLARTVFGFGVGRFSLGLFEAVNFPAAIKIVAEWFPARERALATGIFNCGTNIGAVISPFLVVVLVRWGGWPMAFYATGALGLVWIVAWFLVYESPRRHRGVSPAELALIEGSPDAPSALARIPWGWMLRQRFFWGYVLASVLCGPVWWIFLAWVPDFLVKRFHLTLGESALPVGVIFQMTAIGGIGAGWLSSWLIKHGWTVNLARKSALFLCAICVVPVCTAGITTHLWIAVFLVGMAASSHQGWSANLYSAISDVMPKTVVSTVVGLGAAAAGLATMGGAWMVGRWLQGGGGYALIFCVAATPYIISLLCLHLLVPVFAPAPLDETPPAA